MIYHRPSKLTFPNRLECKKALGGTNEFNRALKSGDLIFIEVHKNTDIIL